MLFTNRGFVKSVFLANNEYLTPVLLRLFWQPSPMFQKVHPSILQSTIIPKIILRTKMRPPRMDAQPPWAPSLYGFP